jgi:DNA-directed RNA polymerase specialized sigma24 family protein
MQRALRAYANRLTNGNPLLADKLLNATITRLAESATAYPPTIIDLTTWAKMVMQNTFRQTTKDADLHELHHLAYHGTLNPMQPCSSKEYSLREQIQMMSRLTPHQAAAATLRLGGYTHAAIAHAMNITPAQAEAHLSKARHTLGHVWDS